MTRSEAFFLRPHSTFDILGVLFCAQTRCLEKSRKAEEKTRHMNSLGGHTSSLGPLGEKKVYLGFMVPGQKCFISSRNQQVEMFFMEKISRKDKN